MASNGSDTLEARLKADILRSLGSIESTARGLLGDENYSQLLPTSLYTNLQRQLNSICNGVLQASELMKGVEQVYGQGQTPEGARETPDPTEFRNRINGIFSVIMGNVHLIRKDKEYKHNLGEDKYVSLHGSATFIAEAAESTFRLIDSLDVHYLSSQRVDASTLGTHEEVYTIVHIDNDAPHRVLFKEGLAEGSNINPRVEGIFGHNGKKVRYNVHSYGSVDEALSAIGAIKNVDLLVTDLNMPEKSGEDLLKILQEDGTKKKPVYGNIGRVVMLTTAVEDVTKGIERRYGVEVLDKMSPATLELKIYRAITQPKPFYLLPQTS